MMCLRQLTWGKERWIKMQPDKNNVSSYIIQSQEQEIKRIALELHEGVGQTLYSLYTGMQFIENAIEQPEMKNYVEDMTHIMEKTIQEVRLLAVELHPPTLITLGFTFCYEKLFNDIYINLWNRCGFRGFRE